MNTDNRVPASGHTISLAQLPRGARARVVGFACDNALRGRLCALGITPGCELDVAQSCEPVCLRVKGCNLVLGNNMASEILCEQVQQNSQAASDR